MTTSDHPEMRPSCSLENEPEFMASEVPQSQHWQVIPTDRTGSEPRTGSEIGDSRIAAWQESFRFTVSACLGHSMGVGRTPNPRLSHRWTLRGALGLTG